MNKLESMRAHLLAIPGELKIDPDDLMTFADQGTVYSASSGTNRHFEMRYKANIIIHNYSGSADRLMFWLLQWMTEHQPDHVPEALEFQADLLNHHSADISITVALTETVRVEQAADGIRLHHCDPTIPPDDLPANPWTLYVRHRSDETPITTWVDGG